MADDTSPQQLIDDAAKALGETPIADVPEEQKIEQIAPPAETPRMEEPAILPEPPKIEEIIVPETPAPVVPSMPDPIVEPAIEPKKEEVPQVEIPIPTETTNIPLADITPLPPLPTPEPMVNEKEEEKLATTISSQQTQEEQETDTPPSPQKPKTKKGGKGALIAALLFFILTLPIAIYYVTQSPQFAEIRSRASGGECKNIAPYPRDDDDNTSCFEINCQLIKSAGPCAIKEDDYKNKCCKWYTSVIPTPTYAPTKTPTPKEKPPTPTDKISGCPGIKNWTPGKAPLTPSIKCNTNGTIHDFYGYCVFYHCPQGCGTGGCGEGDPGVWWEFGACNSNKLKSSECGQIDTIFGTLGGGPGNYCIPETGCDALIQCGASCSGGSTATPKQPTKTPTKKPTITGTTVPTATNTPTGTTEPTATNTPTATSTPAINTPTATPTTTTNTPVPGTCDASCDNDGNCESGLSCVTSTGVKRCREADCPDETDCSCPAATATPTTTYYANNTPVPTRVSLIASVPTATPTSQPTPKIPVAGIGPGIIGALSVAGSILLLLIGLAL